MQHDSLTSWESLEPCFQPSRLERSCQPPGLSLLTLDVLAFDAPELRIGMADRFLTAPAGHDE